MSGDRSDLAARLLAGDKRALARAISRVENNDPERWELVRAIYPHTGRAEVVGFTEPAGAGKSTLIAALVGRQRAQDRQVAVLSIDPSSPFSGAPCSAIGSGCPSTTLTAVCSFARWRPAGHSAASPTQRHRRRC